MKVQDFLHQDLHKAREETVCVMDCMLRLHHATRDNNYTEARIAAEDAAKSFKQLEQLNQKKIELDRVMETVSRLKAAGIEISVLKRWE